MEEVKEKETSCNNENDNVDKLDASSNETKFPRVESDSVVTEDNDSTKSGKNESKIYC